MPWANTNPNHTVPREYVCQKCWTRRWFTTRPSAVEILTCQVCRAETVHLSLYSAQLFRRQFGARTQKIRQAKLPTLAPGSPTPRQ